MLYGEREERLQKFRRGQDFERGFPFEVSCIPGNKDINLLVGFECPEDHGITEAHPSLYY
jgi:hypothetical protein